jgi:DnaD/phage-associated family protein
MPNRIIKESIRGSDDLATVSAEAERLFWRIVVSVDDFGRFDARPKTIIGQCMTAFLGDVTSNQVNSWLTELERVGLLQLYVVEDRPYLVLTKWSKHQRKRAKDSKFPSPDEDCGHLLTDDSKRSHTRTFAAYNENENEYVNEIVNENENENENDASEDTILVDEAAATSDNKPMNSSSSLDHEFGQVAKLYESEGFGLLSNIVCEQLSDLYSEFGVVWLTEAMKESVFQNKRRLKYTRSILQNWRAEGGIRRSGGVGFDIEVHRRTRASPGEPEPNSVEAFLRERGAL